MPVMPSDDGRAFVTVFVRLGTVARPQRDPVGQFVRHGMAALPVRLRHRLFELRRRLAMLI